MKERRPYQIPERRKEWIELEGGDLCLFSFTMADVTAIETYSMRPPEDPRGGIDLAEAALWQIAFACYEGDQDTARRRWSDLQVHEIRSLPSRDFQRLIVAINTMNGTSPEAEELARDFTPAGESSS